MIDFNEIEKYKENNRIEAKKALGGLPESIWETYSAFANTLGGILLLGVEELPDKTLRCIDLPDPAKLLRRFRELLEDRTKVSANILSEEDLQLHEIDGKHMISIRVPRALRTDRPVYINQDPFSGTYRRNGEGDYRCTSDEIEAMLRDAAIQTHDMQVCSEVSLDALNAETIARCRACGNSAEDAGAPAFLLRTGAAACAEDGQLRPTAAGILLFGRMETIRSHFPEYRLSYSGASTERRFEDNLLEFYFSVCREIDALPAAVEPDVKRGIREAFANCLINADYYAPGGICVACAPAQISFSNPGSFRIRKESAYAGGISDPRNTIIFRIFKYMNIGKGEGGGIQNLFSVWRRRGFSAPEIREQFQPDRITVLLPLTAERETAPGRLGAAELEAGGAAVIEYLTEKICARAAALSEALGLPLPETEALLAALRESGIVTERPNGSGVFFLKS